MTIYQHQAAAYNEIKSRAELYFAGHWKGLSIQARFHSLLVGPTGTGKTALANLLSRDIGAVICSVSAPSWIPCGAYKSATRQTIEVLAEHIAAHPRTVLFIDELDKIYHEESSWVGHIRGEIFEICDGRWPQGTKPPGMTGYDADDDDEIEKGIATAVANLTVKLRESVFVLGAGTFQSFFDARGVAKTVGFGGHVENPPLISAEEIARRLPRELVNRFNGELVLLPELGEEQYRAIATQAVESLPAWLRTEFSLAVNRRLPMAIAAKKGVRFLEEALMDALMVARPPAPKTAIRLENLGSM